MRQYGVTSLRARQTGQILRVEERVQEIWRQLRNSPRPVATYQVKYFSQFLAYFCAAVNRGFLSQSIRFQPAADRWHRCDRGVFWTRGTDRAHLLIAPGGASRLTLTMFMGPISGDVRVSVAGRETSVRVAANASGVRGGSGARRETGPARDSGARTVPPVGHRSELVDTRRPGCQVRVGLK